MGQKVNPHGLRVGVIKDWDSKWYAEGDFADYLVEDYNIRTFLKKKLYSAGVSKIEIERASGIPILDNTDSKAMWVNFLSHAFPPYLSSSTMVIWLVLFSIL